MENASYIAVRDGVERRVPPRTPEDMQENYLQRFDYRTLISDVYETPDGVEAVMPPPLNLEDKLLESALRIDGALISADLVHYRRADRGAVLSIDVSVGSSGTLEIDGPLGTYLAPIQASGTDVFAGMRVLVTHQKDNDLEWIAYWALHHTALYEFDAVLIYDNNSERYGVHEIERVLQAVPNLKAYRVVSWPTPFGLTGGPNAKWDSDFGQHVFLRDAYSRFLRESDYALICDIDELFVGERAGDSVPNLVLTGAEPIVYSRRKQVVQVLAPGETDHVRSHGSYGFTVANGNYIANKYFIVPRRLEEYPEHWLKVHTPTGAPARTIDPELAHIRHFGGIRIQWRDSWTSRVGNVERWPTALSVDEPFRRDVKLLSKSWSALLDQLRH